MHDFEAFKNSLKQSQPPEDISEPLKALWWDGKGDWTRAHETAQDIHNTQGAWVHAYLHRKEGDKWNSNYWYSHAGRTMSSKPFEQEWEEIVKAFLKKEK